MANSTLNHLDSYCERAGMAGLWAEPLNAVSNLFFISAALVALYLIIRLPPAHWRQRLDFWLLAILLLCIGIGSGLWHTMPSGTTVLMDVVPITLFIHIYLIAAMRRLLQFTWWRVFLWWSVYMGYTVMMQIVAPPDILNGTIMYIPTYCALIMLSLAVGGRSNYLSYVFAQMVLTWTISLVFRTMDIQICDQLSMGTHFIWHILNAMVLYRLLVVLVRYRAPVNLQHAF